MKIISPQCSPSFGVGTWRSSSSRVETRRRGSRLRGREPVVLRGRLRRDSPRRASRERRHGSPDAARFGRVQRVQSLFEDSFSLVPLSYWLPRERDRMPGTTKEVVELLERGSSKPARYTFTGQMERATICSSEAATGSRSCGCPTAIVLSSAGWPTSFTTFANACPPGETLRRKPGNVMVDEIDLHLHPRWQMMVIKTVARALPRMQFIFTSHSPLVAGSLEWMNIITLKLSRQANRTITKRLKESIHGLDADQVLLSDFFGLKTTRAESKTRQLDKLSLQAALGDDQAAERLISKLAEGMEEAE